jgi:hypothetical protein
MHKWHEKTSSSFEFFFTNQEPDLEKLQLKSINLCPNFLNLSNELSTGFYRITAFRSVAPHARSIAPRACHFYPIMCRAPTFLTPHAGYRKQQAKTRLNCATRRSSLRHAQQAECPSFYQHQLRYA